MQKTTPLIPSAAVIVLAAAAACAPARVDIAPAHAAQAAPAADYSAPATVSPKTNTDWWPEQVDLSKLRRFSGGNPYGTSDDYAERFASLDLAAVKADLAVVLSESRDWWPADYGDYTGFFIRMAWHSAGTYRALDGRGGADGGQQRFEPLNSWPDNANLDKARRLLWPVKQKYGAAISWADLMILAGNVAMEEAGFATLGFAGGRVDDWQADVVYWGAEQEMLGVDRFHGNRELEDPLAAVRMGLIYVNPEGIDGNGDPVAAAGDIRSTFARMAMNDVETVALIAGGHTFGKAHGAHKPGDCVGVEPAAAGVEAQGFGWTNTCGSGTGADTTTSGLEGAWTSTPNRWSHQYLTNLYAFEWEQTKSPAGAEQWVPAGGAAAQLVPDAHDPSKRHAPIMFTTDLSLKEDPAYRAITEGFRDDPAAFEAEFAKAWFKLTHRDLGPKSRYLGPEVPEQDFLWQDPIPAIDYELVGVNDVSALKKAILATDLTTSDLVRVAWASASSFRETDMRGGANGARIRLEPQVSWAANDPAELSRALDALERVQAAFNDEATGGTQVSLADVVVLAGAVGVEQAVKAAGASSTVGFVPGRNDAAQDQTDPVSFAFLEPKADGFRNYFTDASHLRPSDALIEKAALLGLDPAEMTALVGGLRVLDANAGGSQHGVFTDRPGVLSNDFFVNLVDMSTTWRPAADGTFEGVGPDGTVRWTATEVDLVFGSNAELRALAEVFAYDEARFRDTFIAAWTKVMRADRFDLHR